MKLEIFGDRAAFPIGIPVQDNAHDGTGRKSRTCAWIKLWGRRMIGVGDLSFETAGESSRIVMRSIDRPQLAADHILELAKSQRLRPDAGPAASQPTP